MLDSVKVTWHQKNLKLVITREKRGWGRLKRVKCITYMVTGHQALSGEHTMRYPDDVLWNCTLEIYILTNVTAISLIKK